MESGEFLPSFHRSSLPSAVNTDSDDGGSVELTEADGADNSSSTQTGLTRDTQGNNLRVTEEEEFKILQ